MKIRRARDNVFAVSGMTEKWWVVTCKGDSFYVARRTDGSWYHMYAMYRKYQTRDQSVIAALEVLSLPVEPLEMRYKRLRLKERVYTLYDRTT